MARAVTMLGWAKRKRLCLEECSSPQAEAERIEAKTMQLRALRMAKEGCLPQPDLSGSLSG